MELCIFVVLVTVGYFWKAKVSLVCYIYAKFLAFNFFHSFNFDERPSEEGLSVIDQEGITSLKSFFLGKNKTKLSWFVRCTLLCSPRHSRVFVILHSTTFRVEYNFWIENTYTVLYACVLLHSFASLRASSPIWASEASLAGTRERAAKGELATIPYKFSFVLRPDEGRLQNSRFFSQNQ